jgi:hypothetical protein
MWSTRNRLAMILPYICSESQWPSVILVGPTRTDTKFRRSDNFCKSSRPLHTRIQDVARRRKGNKEARARVTDGQVSVTLPNAVSQLHVGRAIASRALCITRKVSRARECCCKLPQALPEASSGASPSHILPTLPPAATEAEAEAEAWEQRCRGL